MFEILCVVMIIGWLLAAYYAGRYHTLKLKLRRNDIGLKVIISSSGWDNVQRELDTLIELLNKDIIPT